MRTVWLGAVAALSLGGVAMASTDAMAWHFGVPHGGYHGGGEEVIVERRGRYRDPYLEDDHHYRPRRHRHCREVEYHDHHGRHRVRTVCE